MIHGWPGALFWSSLGVLIAWQSFAHGLGTPAEPGPGMVSFGLGVGMATIALGRAVAGTVRRQATQPAARPSRRVVALCAVLAAYFLLVVPLGFLLATFGIILILLTGFTGIRWPRATAGSAAATLALYGVFKLGLGVQLPAGLVG